jgi:hypothetical protein
MPHIVRAMPYPNGSCGAPAKRSTATVAPLERGRGGHEKADCVRRPRQAWNRATQDEESQSQRDSSTRWCECAHRNALQNCYAKNQSSDYIRFHQLTHFPRKARRPPRAPRQINKKSALDEKGQPIKGRGDTPNQHDILSGTQRDGTAVPGPDDATCGNWTSSADGQGNAVVGHHDLVGNPQGINFWNFSHKTPGCAPANLQRTGGAGFFYCFATN